MTASSSVLVLSTDLMSSVRVVDTATALGYAARTAESAAGIEGETADIVVIDVASSPLPPAEAVERLRRSNPSSRIIAVYRHTDPQQARAVRAAGCDLVLNRARFFGDIPAALRGADR